MYNFPITLFDSRRENPLAVNILIFAVDYMLRDTYFTEVLSVQDVFSTLQLPAVPYSLCSLSVLSPCLSSQGQQGMTDTILCLQYPHFNDYLLFLG